jgi:hypothetical protein
VVGNAGEMAQDGVTGRNWEEERPGRELEVGAGGGKVLERSRVS